MTESIFSKFDMTGKTAIITGAAGLLGKQFCLALAQAGANIVMADLAYDVAAENAAEFKNMGFNAIAVKVDVSDPSSVKSIVDQTLTFFGSVDVLINSAALDPKFDSANVSTQDFNDFETYSLNSWKKALDVNLTGMFLASQAAVLPMLEQGRGVIVNISSMYGLVGPDQRLYEQPDGTRQFKPVYYSVTKAGVLGFTRYLATYYAGKNIRVNALTPGGVFNDHDALFTEQYSTRTVLGRMANLDEMNAAMLFLCSDASSYMTGSNLVVDGGWTAW
ncbi:MAG: SDR family oxidoreductase [Anaerolineaceae bacterium]|jgi:2-deoxy-D-gluconate 3-dehydrogenase|nr:SDR family oxidoreductase [Anaerolineaceae bacterium]